MSETEVAEAVLPLDNAGARLLRAREDAGLSRADVAAITKIPERHLAAIEVGDFGSLPARPYAVGFSRSYAKALGLNEGEIVAQVRDELAEQEPVEPRRVVQTFEPGDPARVPGSQLVWFALAGIVAVLVAVFFLYRSMLTPGMSLPSILADETPAPAASVAAPAPAAAPAGLVVFTATQPKVWVKFTDAAGNQLFQKELSQGESWTLPTDQSDVRLATARPDALDITIGGQPVPRLSDTQKSMRDVPVTAAALLARGSAAEVPAAPTGVPATAPSAAATQAPRAVSSNSPRTRPAQRSAPAVSAPATTPSASAPVSAVPAATAPSPAATAAAPAAT